jgi:ABC-type transport system substrate-binding protein
MKGAFTGAGALALGAYMKPGVIPRFANTSYANLSTKRSGTLSVALNSAPNTLDPALGNELAAIVSLDSIYDGLARYNTSYNTMEPRLATSWTANATATEWVFNLRPNVTFQDGTPFNSSAVRQTILHYVAVGNGSQFGSIKTIDDSEPLVVKITLSEPSPDLLLNQDWVRMLSPKVLAQKTLTTAAGTGPFQLESWQPASEIRVTANPSYWGSPEPYLDGINFHTVGNETARVDGLISGSLDLIQELDPHDLPLLLASHQTLLSGGTWLEICLLNITTESPTSDVRVRQAIAYGIDREALVRDVLLGQASVADSVIPPGCYGHAVPDVQYSYNPAKARQLLKEAGYPKGISLLMAGSSDLASESLLGEAMVPQLAEAGITVDFIVEDIGVLVSDVLSPHPKRQTYIIHYDWGNGGPIHFDENDIAAHAKYTGSALLNLIHKSNTTPDGPTRLSYLRQAQNVWMQVLPHFPLYNPIYIDAFSGSLQGYDHYPTDACGPHFDTLYLK